VIIKHANEVIKHEKEAKDAAKNMEEASLKAHIARKNMISVIICIINFFNKFKLILIVYYFCKIKFFDLFSVKIYLIEKNF